MAPQIMVVEDENIVALDIKSCLTNLGYEVPAVFASGEDALARIAEHKPDLVLLDIMLKGELDGVDVGSRLRDEYGIPVVYLTAYTDDQTLRRAKVTEPYGYLVKPFEEVQLQTSIEVALYKHRKEKILFNEYKRNEVAARRFHDGIFEWDILENRVFLSSGSERLLGLKSAEVEEHPEAIFVHASEEDRSNVSHALQQLLAGAEDKIDMEFRVTDQTGSENWLRTIFVAIRDKDRRPLRVIGSLNDVTVRKTAEDILIHYSFHDPVTDLPNRVSFLDHLGRRIRQSFWDGESKFFIMHMDILHFHAINRLLGLQGGDEFLALIAQKLRKAIPADWYMARIGGDEFCILHEWDGQQTGEELLKPVLSAFGKEMVIHDHKIIPQANIGFLAKDMKFSFPDDILLEAEIAMRKAAQENPGGTTRFHVV